MIKELGRWALAIAAGLAIGELFAMFIRAAMP